MFKKYTVLLPIAKGKITFKKMKEGGTYVYYEYNRVYNKEKKYNVPLRACIGKSDLNDNTRMHPNEKYEEYFGLEASSNILEYTSTRSSCLRAGAFIVISKFLDNYKILEWIKAKFGSVDGGLVLDLLSYLIISEKNAAQHYPDYAYNHPLFSPEMRIYSDSKVGRLFSDSITRDDIIAFTQWWNDSFDHTKRIYISCDSTNRLCQVGDIDIIEPGHPKVGDDGFPIFNVSIAMDVKTGMPLFIDEYSGSINDVSQMNLMREKAIDLGYRKIGFILDRGCFSQSNIENLDSNSYSFIMMVKGKKAFVSSLVLQLKGSFENKRSCRINEYDVSGTTIVSKLFNKERYFHVYYSVTRYATESSELEVKFKKFAFDLSRLIGVETSKDRFLKFEEFYDLTFSENKAKHTVKLLIYREKEEHIERLMNLAGYFVIITSEKMSAKEALLLYKSRDSSEKLFLADKSFLTNRAERIQSEDSLRAKTFIEFLALIIRSRFHYCINEHIKATLIRRNYMNVVSVIAELEKIELIRMNGSLYHLDHAITARQKEILSFFGMSSNDIKDSSKQLANILQTVESKDVRAMQTDEDVRDDSRVEDEEEII